MGTMIPRAYIEVECLSMHLQSQVGDVGSRWSLGLFVSVCGNQWAPMSLRGHVSKHQVERIEENIWYHPLATHGMYVYPDRYARTHTPPHTHSHSKHQAVCSKYIWKVMDSWKWKERWKLFIKTNKNRVEKTIILVDKMDFKS